RSTMSGAFPANDWIYGVGNCQLTDRSGAASVLGDSAPDKPGGAPPIVSPDSPELSNRGIHKSRALGSAAHASQRGSQPPHRFRRAVSSLPGLSCVPIEW